MSHRIAPFLALLLASSIARAAAPAAPAPVEPALPPDPKIVSIVDALGDNTAAALPPLKCVGEWNAVTKEFGMERNGPMGRDFTNKAVWMPDRKRAFFCGANHGSPHRLDDAWEHDLLSNTWVLLFAPDPHNAQGVSEIAEAKLPVSGKTVKYVRTKRGGPTHYGHTWWGLAYDPNIKAALWMNCGIGSSPQAYLKKELGDDPSIYGGPPLWAFYPAEKEWKQVFTEGPAPHTPYAGAMEFVPELGGVFWYSANWNGAGMDVYLPDKHAWKALKPNKGENLYHSKEAPRPESIMCYDRANQRVVAQDSTRNTYHYDLKTNTWKKVLSPGKDSPDAPGGHDARSVMYYDPLNKVCLLWDSKDASFWAYDPAAVKWTKQQPQGDAVAPGGKHVGYFDEARNVFVVNRGARTWVYRYKRAAK